MKKIVLTTAFAMSVFFAQAQITIKRSDIANKPATFKYIVDENFVAPSNIEESGSGKTWDFTNLQMNGVSITKFVEPNTQADFAKFPTANLAIVLDSSAKEVYYIEDNSDSMVVVGTNEPLADGARFRQLVFPMSLNNTWKNKGNVQKSDAAPGSGFDSVRYNLEYTFTNTVESEGKLQLPGGSIDVIKVFTLAETNGSFEVQVGGIWQPTNTSSFTDSSYSFYAPNNGFYILTVTKQDDGTYDAKYKYNDDIVGLASINKIKQLENAVRVYPNPTTQYLNIESAKVDTYIITDILGKNIMNGNTTSTIDVSNLAKGNYMIQLFQNEKLISVNKFIKD